MKKILDIPWFRSTLIIIALLCITLVSVQTFAKTSFQYDSFSFDLSTSFNVTGGTRIVIPPVGQLFFKSHLTPWQMIITLDEINFLKLEAQLNSLPPKQQWLTIFQNEVLKALIFLFLKMIIVSITSAVIFLLAIRISPRSALFKLGILSSVLMILLLIGTTILTYNEAAVNHPQYQGVLESAPWAMNLITMGLDNIEVIGNNLKKISHGLPMLYKQAGQIKNIGDFQTDLAVLHVSDIHNNPAAFDFIAELVTNFNIKFIIDTGDLTDYGTALEAELIKKITQIKVPYIFIPGNHDSPLITKRLQELKTVTIIKNGTYQLAGITVIGQGDPAADSYNSDLAPEVAMEKARQSLNELIASAKEVPQIVAVHNREIAKDLIGKVPLIIHGHDHRYQLNTITNTIIDDAGTTGAAGLRGLTGNGVPYSASILYWKNNQNGTLELHAVDSIKVNGNKGSLTIVRNTFPKEE